MAKKVLVTEEVDPAGLAILKNRGLDVDVRLGLDEDELVEAIAGYSGLIVRSHTVVSSRVIEAGLPDLKIIGRAGVSVDNIDLEAATEHGIIVCNAPSSNIVSAAEHALAMIMACARKIGPANESMHRGQWDPSSFKGTELYEKTLAIFGLGRVGGLVAQRAAAFGMKLVGYDPYCSRERAAALDVELFDDIEDILPVADFITVHLPRTTETIGMFGPNEFVAMKDGVVLVNVAAGGIFDEKALADFVAAEKVGAAAIDVFVDEPCTSTPLHEFDNVLLTPHIGASTREAQRRAGVQIATYMAQGLAGSIVPTAVNMTLVPPEVVDTVGPYLTACQMMGKVLSQINPDMPRDLQLTTTGTLAGIDADVLLASALKGILSYKNVGAVTAGNVKDVARRHGINAETRYEAQSMGYASSVRLVADGTEIACTLHGAMRPARIISLFDYSFDIEPAAQALVFEYEDAPGRIGLIGTILGNAGINITTMQIGRREDTDNAIVFMNVEGDMAQAVLDELKSSIDELQNLWCISL